MTAKTRAIPSLHPRCSLRSRGARRDSKLPKVYGHCPVLRQATQPPHIAGPLAGRCTINDNC